MGQKSTKIISHSEASGRVHQYFGEAKGNRIMHRWYVTFNKLVKDSKMDLSLFSRTVFGDYLSPSLTKLFFSAFSSDNDLLNFQDFLCGLVVFFLGDHDEKMKMLYVIYGANQNSLSREALDKFLKTFSTGVVVEIIDEAFSRSEKNDTLNFDEFCIFIEDNFALDLPLVSWVNENIAYILDIPDEPVKEKTETVVSEIDISFFDPEQVRDIRNIFSFMLKHQPAWLGNKPVLEKMTLLKHLSPFIPEEVASRLFDIGLKGSQEMRFNQFILMLSMLCGDEDEIYDIMFQIFDLDNDQVFDGDDLVFMLKVSKLFHLTNFPSVEIEIDSQPEEKEISNDAEEAKPSLSKDMMDYKQSVDYAIEKSGQILSDNGTDRISKEHAIEIMKNLIECHELNCALKRSVYTHIGLKCSTIDQEKEVINAMYTISENNKKIGDKYFVVAASWFRKWQQYVNNDDPRNSSRPGKIVNSSILHKKGISDHFNSLLKSITNVIPLDSDYVQIKSELVENRDYFLLPKNVFQTFIYWYDVDQIIERKLILKDDALVTEVYPLVVTIELEPNLVLPNGRKINDANFYLSRSMTINELKRTACFRMAVHNVQDVRVWLKKNPKECLEHRSNFTLETVLNDQSTLILERKIRGEWPFGELDDPSPKEKKLVQAKKSYDIIPGAIGLKNLGNTCYMNASLQCLSNTEILKEYFVSNGYKSEINRNNPLGMKGEVAESYARLSKYMWPKSNRKSSTPNPVIAPADFKRIIGKFAPQFEGVRQQDALEFINFLLDGLHEDLNRVIEKPYVPNPDYEGQPDDELSEIYWDNYKKRNQSIIVDLFTGQLRSTLISSCEHRSITFDPYLFLSLPLPMDDEKIIEIIFFFQKVDKKKPQKFVVTLNREEGSSTDLYNDLSELTEIPVRNILLSSIDRNYISSVVPPQIPASRVRDVLYGYQVSDNNLVFPIENQDSPSDEETEKIPENINNITEPEINGIDNASDQLVVESKLETQNIFIVHRKVKEGKLYFITPIQSRLISCPQVLSIPIECTAEHLKLIVNESIEGLKTDEINTDSYVIRNVNVEGTMCSICPWYLFCGGCAIPSEGIIDHILQKSHTLSIDWDVEPDLLNTINLDKKGWFKSHPSVKKILGAIEKPITFDECINWFTQDEYIGDDVYCSTCEEHKPTNKKMDVWKTPPILIVHLKRFQFYNNRWRKSNRLVEFPLNDLFPSEWFPDTRIVSEEENQVYDLYGVVNHYGSLEGGHYTAFSYHKSEDVWYLYDDSRIRIVEDPSTIMSPASYILFYKRRDLVQEEILDEEILYANNDTTDDDIDTPPEESDPTKRTQNEKKSNNDKPQDCTTM